MITIMRKCKSWTSLNFYVYARSFIHHLYLRTLHLRPYAHENYMTVEIHPNERTQR